MNQRQNLAASYTALDGYTSQAGAAQTSRPGPPSLREVDGSLGRGPPRKEWKIRGNKRASRAHNLPPFPARMSARSRAKWVETYPVG